MPSIRCRPRTMLRGFALLSVSQKWTKSLARSLCYHRNGFVEPSKPIDLRGTLVRREKNNKIDRSTRESWSLDPAGSHSGSRARLRGIHGHADRQPVIRRSPNGFLRPNRGILATREQRPYRADGMLKDNEDEAPLLCKRDGGMLSAGSGKPFVRRVSRVLTASVS